MRWPRRIACLSSAGGSSASNSSTVEWPGFKDVYDAYSDHLVPRMGKAIAGDEESYRYLVESIRRFPPMPQFERMIREAGFRHTKVEPILGGLVAIHSGWKI